MFFFFLPFFFSFFRLISSPQVYCANVTQNQRKKEKKKKEREFTVTTDVCVRSTLWLECERERERETEKERVGAHWHVFDFERDSRFSRWKLFGCVVRARKHASDKTWRRIESRVCVRRCADMCFALFGVWGGLGLATHVSTHARTHSAIFTTLRRREREKAN